MDGEGGEGGVAEWGRHEFLWGGGGADELAV